LAGEGEEEQMVVVVGVTVVVRIKTHAVMGSLVEI